MQKNFIVIPVYNEEKRIKEVITKVKKSAKNIIVVSDGSSDKTNEIIRKFPGIIPIILKKNRGKGEAMKIGAKVAWKKGARAVVFMDGDGQHNPLHLKKFFLLLNRGEDIVIGIRILKANVPLYRKIGNKLMLYLFKALFNVEIEDLLCGYRAVSRKIYPKIVWNTAGYGVETEMLTKIGQKNIPFKKIVVDTIYLDKYKGFSALQGFLILLKIPLWKLRSQI